MSFDEQIFVLKSKNKISAFRVQYDLTKTLKSWLKTVLYIVFGQDFDVATKYIGLEKSNIW